MKRFASLRWSVAAVLLVFNQTAVQCAEPLKALLITGGGSHDYEHQKALLTDGISARANIVWTIVDEANGDKTHEAKVYDPVDWSKGYDVIVHDECFGAVTNVALTEKIAHGHAGGIPAVVLHASIHSYRNANTDDWRKLLGVSSYQHEALRAFKVENLQPDNPIMKGFPIVWQDHPDELYEIKKLWPECVPLAKGTGVKGAEHVCVWVNTYGKTRVFGTTLGHGNETVTDPVYLDLVTRGLLWACDKLEDNGKPKAGYGPK